MKSPIKKSEFTKVLNKISTLRTAMPKESRIFEILYKSDGTIMNVEDSGSNIFNYILPDKLIDSSIFEYLLPTNGLNKAQFKKLLTTKITNQAGLLVLLPCNPKNISESDYYNTDVLELKNGIHGVATLRYIGKELFLIQIIVKDKFILEMPGIITSDILIMLDDKNKVLWYSYALIPALTDACKKKKKFSLEDILSKKSWRLFSNARKKAELAKKDMQKNPKTWKNYIKDPLRNNKNILAFPDYPWDSKNDSIGSVNDGMSFCGYKLSAPQNKKDIAVTVDISLDPSDTPVLRYGIILNYNTRSTSFSNNAPDLEGYSFNATIFNNSELIPYNFVLKRKGNIICTNSFYNIDKRTDKIKKAYKSKSFKFRLERSGALFIAYINDSKVFEFMDENPILSYKHNTIGFINKGANRYKNLEIQIRQSSLKLHKMPPQYIDFEFIKKPGVIYESYMTSTNFQSHQTPTLYLKDVTNSRILNNKLENRMLDLKSDLKVAKTFQTSLAKIRLSKNPGFKYSSTYVPAGEVGGDMIDIIELGNGKFGVVIFDVSGHGIASALVCGIAKNIIRNAFNSKKSLTELASEINSAMVNTAVSEMYITAFLGTFDIKKRTLTYISAGHPQQYLIAPASHKIEALENPNAVIGMMEEFQYNSTTIKIPKNTKLFLFTDGLIEAKSPSGEQYLKTRLTKHLESCKELSIEEIKQEILTDLVEFTETSLSNQEDDIALMIMEF